jgi:hypothetical protein
LVKSSTLVLVGDSRYALRSFTHVCVILMGLMFTSISVKESGTFTVEMAVDLNRKSFGTSVLVYVVQVSCAEDGCPTRGMRATSARITPAPVSNRNIVRFRATVLPSERLPQHSRQSVDPTIRSRLERSAQLLRFVNYRYHAERTGVNALLSIPTDFWETVGE